MVLVAACLALSAPVHVFSQGLSATGLTQGGRVPVARDAVAAKFAANGAFEPGGEWQSAVANSEGWFERLGGGYLATAYESPSEETLMLEATGHSVVYVNGVPRGGDPYAYGYLRLPVRLKKGANQFVFGGGRGRVKASLTRMRAAQQLDAADVTVPDAVQGETQQLFGGIVIANGSQHPVTDLTLTATVQGKRMSTKVPEIGPLTTRKVRFDFAAPTTDPKVQLTLERAGKVLDELTVEVRLRKPTEPYKRTFVSRIDGSVQYYGITPALKPARSNGLVLTLHGASVEGIGQAQAYAPKESTWIVAPTNRRPYGFDWEDWGRMDALEVLAHAKRSLPHDPAKVYLTGHSMGGHGTWAIGTLFPDQFAAIAPSAGWVSFWSYAGGWQPRDPTPAESVMRASMNVYDTLLRGRNLADLGVYILHGDADDNVPVSQARAMREFLQPWHSKLQYHEQPGAGHWWGNECVDWPGIFQMYETSRISTPKAFSFTTPNPGVSGTYRWLQILQPVEPKTVSAVEVNGDAVKTSNVRAMKLDKAFGALDLDGQSFRDVRAGTTFVKSSVWMIRSLEKGSKAPGTFGPLKEAMQNRMALVFGTGGTAEENAWAYHKARFDAETWYYRGNGAVDVVSDRASQGFLRDRNLVLYGNADTNRVWARELAHSPIKVSRASLAVGGHPLPKEMAITFCYPRSSGDGMIAAFGSPTLTGSRVLDRLPIFTSGVGYPDYTVFGPDAYDVGTKGIVLAGYFGNDWKLP